MPVTRIKEKAVETVETVGKNSKESESEYLENLAQILYIFYSIIFRKKFVPIFGFFDSGNKVNINHPTFA